MLTMREMDEIKIAAEAWMMELTQEYMKEYTAPYTDEEPISPQEVVNV